MRHVLGPIIWGLAILSVVLIGSGNAHAETLKVSPDAPFIAHLGAGVLLYAHIIGGAIGLASGITASFTKKGSKLHRVSGHVFLFSMFVTYLVGSGVAPFLETGQRPNFVAGILALYLLISGVAAAKRKRFEAGVYEYAGLVTAFFVAAMGAVFAYIGMNSPTGTIDGTPPQAFVLFILLGTIAMLGEVHVIVRKSISYSVRISRHLWRMCASFFIASASLFLGQPRVFPDWFNASPAPFLLSFVPIFVLVGYSAWHRLPKRKRHIVK